MVVSLWLLPDLSEHSTTPTKGRILSHTSVSTMRELHKVTTERDQLRFELEKVRVDSARSAYQAPPLMMWLRDLTIRN